MLFSLAFLCKIVKASRDSCYVTEAPVEMLTWTRNRTSVESAGQKKINKIRPCSCSWEPGLMSLLSVDPGTADSG